MVKDLVNRAAAQLICKKPLGGAVYKRQRKPQTSAPRNTAVSETSLNPRSTECTALASKRSRGADKSPVQIKANNRQQRVVHNLPADFLSLKGAHRQTHKAASQSLQPSTAAPHHSLPGHQADSQQAFTWGLTHEAQYFAKLDAEALIEDGQDHCHEHGQDGRQPPVGLPVVQQLPCPSARSTHRFVLTPDAVALAKYHPELQAEYNQYVRCMGSDQYLLTPMPLEDFCRLAGKGARGLPVFNT